MCRTLQVTGMNQPTVTLSRARDLTRKHSPHDLTRLRIDPQCTVACARVVQDPKRHSELDAGVAHDPSSETRRVDPARCFRVLIAQSRAHVIMSARALRLQYTCVDIGQEYQIQTLQL